ATLCLIRAAPDCHPLLERTHLVLGKRPEAVGLELGVLPDCVFRHVDVERTPFAIELGMADRQEKSARRKPAARVDHRVMNAAGYGVENEAVEIPELAAVGAANIQAVEVDGRVVDVVRVEVAEA